MNKHVVVCITYCMDQNLPSNKRKQHSFVKALDCLRTVMKHLTVFIAVVSGFGGSTILIYVHIITSTVPVQYVMHIHSCKSSTILLSS